MAVVVFKLGMLFLKQAAKPVSTYMKGRAKVSESFRKVCANSAQWMHVAEKRVIMATSGGSVRLQSVKPLDHKIAVETGAEILGEAVVLSITAAITYIEFKRGAADAAKKKEKLEAEFESNARRVQQLQGDFAAAREDTTTMMMSDKWFSREEVEQRVKQEQERLATLAAHRPHHEQQFIDRIAAWTEHLQRTATNHLVKGAAANLLSFLPRSPSSSITSPSPPSEDARS
mmetsp:Transcript_9724/g.22488  ORF Transcript_9724/g.22488 Transcript_9724/m.22488 type:complete len:230 (+) Transcript_9724:113-802(+)